MIQAILFDLDDTLYVEAEFFRSGFSDVARLLGERGVAAPGIAAMLEEIRWNEGRDGVFDKAAARLGFPATWIPELVTAFRAHVPAISPAPEVLEILVRLRGRYKLGCITDGPAAVQRRKIEALGIEPYLDAIVVADDHGRDHWKPSAVPFHACCERLGVSASQAIYIGDYPERDVRGARNAGMRCVRIRRPGGFYSTTSFQEAADYEISTLSEVEGIVDGLAFAQRPNSR